MLNCYAIKITYNSKDYFFVSYAIASTVQGTLDSSINMSSNLDRSSVIFSRAAAIAKLSDIRKKLAEVERMIGAKGHFHAVMDTARISVENNVPLNVLSSPKLHESVKL